MVPGTSASRNDVLNRLQPWLTGSYTLATGVHQANKGKCSPCNTWITCGLNYVTCVLFSSQFHMLRIYRQFLTSAEQDRPKLTAKWKWKVLCPFSFQRNRKLSDSFSPLWEYSQTQIRFISTAITGRWNWTRLRCSALSMRTRTPFAQHTPPLESCAILLGV